MASWFAGRTAEDTAAASLHYHGGYGFMLEYDVQLYLRRAKAWRLAVGDPAGELAVVADRLDAAGWELEPPTESADEGRSDPTAWRREVRDFLAEHCPPELVERVWASGTLHDWGLHRALAERGWLTASWPKDEGGLGLDPFAMAEMTEELARVDAPMDGWGTAELVARTIDLCGTEAQRREILPRILGGDALACLGYSEPDSGSDIAAASTRAVRDGDDWIVNGQKMFTTMAHESAYVLLLTRTNVDVPKHRGLDHVRRPHGHAGHRDQPDRDARRRAHQRDLLHRRARARRVPHRRRRRRLARRSPWRSRSSVRRSPPGRRDACTARSSTGRRRPHAPDGRCSSTTPCGPVSREVAVDIEVGAPARVRDDRRHRPWRPT